MLCIIFEINSSIEYLIWMWIFSWEQILMSDSAIHKKEDRDKSVKGGDVQMKFISWIGQVFTQIGEYYWAMGLVEKGKKQTKTARSIKMECHEEHLNSFILSTYQTGHIKIWKYVGSKFSVWWISRRQKKLIVYNIDQIRGSERVYFWLSFHWFP